MIFKVITLLIVLCISSRNNGVVASLPRGEEFQILNKSDHVKTIQLEGGEIVDCIDLYKQPAFSHPLLKDHKIQTLPQSYLARREKQLQALRLTGKACPSGTVPVRRTTKKELVMSRALHHSSVLASNKMRDHHLVFVNLERFETIIRYHGASGVVSVYNLSLNLDNREMTQANIWMENGPLDVLNYIIVGLAVGVSPDVNPRLFTFWSVDGGKTGCYNLQCGFIQVDSEIAPGHLFIPVSTFDGPTYDVKIKIFQDRRTGNWLLSVHDEDIVVGYFPEKLFPYLKYGAQQVAWGGATYIGDNGNSPPMGSGYQPDGNYNHAAYFRKLSYFDQNFVLREPSPDTRLFHYIDKSGCYGFENGPKQGDYWGSSFLFGGPGGQYCGIY